MVLWLKQKTHDLEVVGSNPHCGDHFSCTIHLDQSMEAKIEWKLTWHCYISCNPAKGRLDFVDGWLIKSSFITKGWNECLSANQEQTPTKKPEHNSNEPEIFLLVHSSGVQDVTSTSTWTPLANVGSDTGEHKAPPSRGKGLLHVRFLQPNFLKFILLLIF